MGHVMASACATCSASRWTTGVFSLTPEEFGRIAGFGFVSGKSTHADRLRTIRDTWERYGVMIDTTPPMG